MRNPICYICGVALNPSNGCIIKEGRSPYNALMTCRGCIDAHVLRPAVEGVKACIPEANRMTDTQVKRSDPNATPPMGRVQPSTLPNMTSKRKTLPPDARDFKAGDIVVFVDDTRGERYMVRSFNLFTDDLEIYDGTASGGTRIVDGQDMCILMRRLWRVGDEVIFRDVFEKRGVAILYTIATVNNSLTLNGSPINHNPGSIVLACVLDLD